VTQHDLALTLPARPENVIVVRQAVAGLGETLGLPPQRVDDLKTVVGEACNNVVLHAYDDEPGPLEVTASSGPDGIEIVIADRGHGFQPRTDPGEEEPSLGLGLPLIASLSDGFEIRGAAGEGTRTLVRFAFQPAEISPKGPAEDLRASDELSLALTPGELVRPVLARVLGALAVRADLSVDRLADTVLLGDAVSSGRPEDFATGRLGISIQDGDGTLDVRVGPLAKGAGARIMEQMDLPSGGSLRTLARSMEIERGSSDGGEEAEFLVFEVSR